MLLSLLWCSVSTQTCETSTAQIPVEIRAFNNDTGVGKHFFQDVLVDSSSNRYLFSLLENGGDVYLTKVLSDGTYNYTKVYQGVEGQPKSLLTVFSNDESIIRMLSRSSGQIVQVSEIQTSKIFLNQFVILIQSFLSITTILEFLALNITGKFLCALNFQIYVIFFYQFTHTI